MAYDIRQDIIPGLPKKAYRNGVSAWEGVVSHSTATPEASDENEDRYSHNNWNKVNAFPHVYCDWDSITQVADFNYQAWGAGNGNPRYVHVELCETKDPDKFVESYKRYVWMIAFLLKKKNLGVKDGVTLVSHEWVSKHLGGTTHTDPIGYLANHGISWAQHVANVATEYNGASQSVHPVKQPSGGYVKRDGWVEIVTSNLNVRRGPGTNYGIVRQLGPTEKQFPFGGVQNGWYDLGGQWIYGNNGAYAKEIIHNAPPAAPAAPHKVGDTVTLQSFATNYASGETIAQSVKGKSYKIIQVKPWARSNSKVAYLLSGIMSWVLEQDVR